jgi:hypothetical protein
MKKILLILIALTVLSSIMVSFVRPAIAITSTGASVLISASAITTMNVTMPASISSGDLLIAAAHVRNTGTWTLSTGWVELGSQVGGATVGELTVFYKIADGTEGATQTFTASVGTSVVWHTRKITDWHGTTPPEMATASGDVSDANPPTLTPSWGSDETLWISVAGHSAISPTAFSAAPAGYTDFLNSGASAGGASVSLATAYLVSTTATEDPGAFTTSGSNRYWAAANIAVRPSGATPAVKGSQLYINNGTLRVDNGRIIVN